MAFGTDQGWPPPGWGPPPEIDPRVGPSRRGPLLVMLALLVGSALLVSFAVIAAGGSLFRSRTVSGANPVLGGDAHGQPPTTPDPPAGGIVLTPAQAAGVVRSYWAVHERALADHDVATLARLNVGAAQDWEQPAVRCGCLSITRPRPLQDMAILLARQRSFPATLLAEVLTPYSGTYWVELVAFEKTAAGRPWQVRIDSGFGPTPGTEPRLIAGDLDPQGYDKPVPATQRARAQQAAADLARVWTTAKDTGRVPVTSEFDLADAGGRRVGFLAQHRQDTPQSNGIRGHFTFFVSDADPVIEAATENGGALACQPVRETVSYTAEGLRRIYQDRMRRNWGPELAPGLYHHLTDVDTWQTCYLVPLIPVDPVTILDQDVGGGRVQSSS